MKPLHLCLYQDFLPRLNLSKEYFYSLYHSFCDLNRLRFLGWKSKTHPFTTDATDDFITESVRFVSFFSNVTHHSTCDFNYREKLSKLKHYTHDMVVDGNVDIGLQSIQKTLGEWLNIDVGQIRFLFIHSNIILLPHRDNDAGVKNPELRQNSNYKIAYESVGCADVALNWVLSGSESIFRIITPEGKYDNSLDTSSVVMFDPCTHKHATSSQVQERLTFSVRLVGITLEESFTCLKDHLNLVASYPS